MKIISWNVNGYDTNVHLWLSEFIKSSKPDIIFLSEIKKKEVDMQKFFEDFKNYNSVINSHQPSNLHGVALLIRKRHSFEEITNFQVEPRKDTKTDNGAKGRFVHIKVALETGDLDIIATYVPNSGRSDKEKLDYRINIWDAKLQEYLNELKEEGRKVIWLGDINVALDNIDVSNPSSMKRYAGYTTEERESFRGFLKDGDFVDIWRHMHPTEKGYSWVSDNRRDDHGMRLDNFIITKNLVENIKDSFMITDCPLSDHIPIGITID